MLGASPWRSYFYGVDTPMETDCRPVPRTFLNNAATPQVAKPVIRRLLRALPGYAYDNELNPISQDLHADYQGVREAVLQFAGGDEKRDAVVFTPTSTAAINLLSNILQRMEPNQIVISTSMEHMANYLPFRERFDTKLVELTPDGQLDLNHYQYLLEQYQGKVKLVAVTGASNITGIIPPFYQMASMAHAYGAALLLDAVQLVQHRPFSMKPYDDPEHIDFVTFDGHKCYTGQSGGVLIGPKEWLDPGEPLIYGGGIAGFVSDQGAVYHMAPERLEAGYPDYLGVLSLGNALSFLQTAELSRIARHEASLYRYAAEWLQGVPGMHLYGAGNSDGHVPILAFNLEGVPYQKLAGWLGYDYGIAVAGGVAGANLYVQRLLGLSNDQAYECYCSGHGFGLVRASIGMYNSQVDIDRLIDALYWLA